MKEVPLHLSALTLEIMKGPKRGLEIFFYSRMSYKPNVSTAPVVPAHTSCCESQEAFERAKKGNHKEGSCFQGPTEHEPVRFSSSLKIQWPCVKTSLSQELFWGKSILSCQMNCTIPGCKPVLNTPCVHSLSTGLQE